MSSYVGLADYGQQGLNGFGAVTQQDLGNILKALEAGYVGTTGGAALKVQSLEQTLKVLSYSSKHIKFWKNISKTPAYSTVEDYNQVTAYGAQGRHGFLPEGNTPQGTDSSYVRRSELVKFIGTTREVTHPASIINAAHGPLMIQNNNEGILWILERIETALFKGDASLALAGGEGLQFNGLDALIDPTMYVDLEGDPLQESDIEEGTQLLTDEYAFANELYLGTRPKSNLVKTLQSRQRFPMPYPVEGRIGQSIHHMETDGGDIAIEKDIFLKKQPLAPAAATPSLDPLYAPPATPQGITLVAADQTGVGIYGDFVKSQSVDSSYAYVVTAVNRYGESAPTTAGAATVAMTQAHAVAQRSVTVQVQNAAIMGVAQDYFRVYRSRAYTGAAPTNFSDYSLVFEFGATNNTANANQTVQTDTNLIMPFTYQAYLGQNDESVLTFRQLAPLMKMDLAVLGPAYRWMILMYGTPILFAPKKWLKYINIGDLT